MDHSQVEPNRRRVVIEGVDPELDAGRFPIKRVTGEEVQVEADIFSDGHDALAAVVLYRWADDSEWSQAPMEELVNDRWRGSFTGVLEESCTTPLAMSPSRATWFR
jgi:starch synthase (maltosyl-transferring)